MTEPKRSRFDQLADFITKRKGKDQEFEEEGIPGHSIKIMADKKLESRLEEWNFTLDLINAPIDAKNLKEYCQDLQDIIQTVHKMVCRIAGVYACAGDIESRNGAILMGAWSELAGSYRSKALRCLRWWGTVEPVIEDSDKLSNDAINVFNFHLGMHNVFFKYADKVVMFCFKRIDVTPRHITTIQTMVPNQHNLPFGFGPQQNTPPGNQ